MRPPLACGFAPMRRGPPGPLSPTPFPRPPPPSNHPSLPSLPSRSPQGRVSVGPKELDDVAVRQPAQNSGIGDLVAGEVKDGQHGPVRGRIEKRIAAPGRRERAGLGLAVADHARHDQVRVVACSAEGVRQGISKLTTFVNRAWSLRRRVAWYSARKRKLAEQMTQPASILADLGIDLAVGSFEIGIGHNSGTAVAGTADKDHVEIASLDGPVEMRIHEVEAGRRAPMA